jgi:magnesium chelatase subunit I
LQEGDIQIRGFKLRMPLDLQFVFTANPEDYTNRKHSDSIERQNRISNIDTLSRNGTIARTITEQEAKLDAIQSDMVHVLLRFIGANQF